MRFTPFLLAVFLLTTSAWADEITVTLSGMTCEACAQTMEKKFSKEDSVQNVSASFAAQEIVIDEKDKQKLSDEKIAEIINWGGYELKEIRRN